MKKILVISDEFPPYGGGAGVVAKQMLEGLQSNGHHVELLTNNLVKKKNKHKPYSILSVFRIKILWLFFYLFKFFFIKWSKYDTIILNDANTILPFVFFGNKTIRKKTLLIVHGTDLIDSYLYKKSFLFKLANEKFKILLQEVKLVIGVSDFMKNYVHQAHPELTNLKRWYSGVDFDSFKVLDDTKFVDVACINILTVSRVVLEKGYEEMYLLFKQIHDKNKRYKWHIAGDGKFLNEFKSKVKHELMDEFIVFHGKLNSGELANLYNKMDVFMLLSNEEESFGLVYVEAQYFGLPVISNNKGGPKEIITLESGFLVQNIEDAVNIFKRENFKILDPVLIKKNALRFDLKKSINQLEKMI